MSKHIFDDLLNLVYSAENLDEFFDNILVSAQEFAVIDDISQSDQENEGQSGEVGTVATVGDEEYNTGESIKYFDNQVLYSPKGSEKDQQNFNLS